jgi:hypothetical protein
MDKVQNKPNSSVHEVRLASSFHLKHIEIIERTVKAARSQNFINYDEIVKVSFTHVHGVEKGLQALRNLLK